ncbi:hypothetical protein ACFXJ8_05000 [Nonomuraea sp. NPDC059194]|uniref:hypothetical protein n=1 Tax=Nonomuraea sp. NPDC059194 TaxID=3346764 RepID=UPI0036AE6BA5
MKRMTPNRLLAFADGLLTRAVPGVVDRTASWVLSCAPSAVPSAQRMTRTRLELWGLQDQAKVAELLVAELVTDALRHGMDRIRVTLSAEDGLLRCEVEHPEPSRHRPPTGARAQPAVRPGLLLGHRPYLRGEGRVVRASRAGTGLIRYLSERNVNVRKSRIRRTRRPTDPHTPDLRTPSGRPLPY